MNVKGIEHITVGQLIKLSEVLTMPLKSAVPKHRKWNKEHGLDDFGGKRALELSKIITGYYDEFINSEP